jgi:hypothetical protein
MVMVLMVALLRSRRVKKQHCLFASYRLPDFFQIISFRHYEQTFSFAARFPNCPNRAFFFRVGKQMLALVFYHELASIIELAKEVGIKPIRRGLQSE